jgi:hypothetical protein
MWRIGQKEELRAYKKRTDFVSEIAKNDGDDSRIKSFDIMREDIA